MRIKNRPGDGKVHKIGRVEYLKNNALPEEPKTLCGTLPHSITYRWSSVTCLKCKRLKK